MKRVIRKILLIILLVTTTNLSIPLNVFAENTSYPYSGTCGDNITWTFDENGVLNIRGSGDMHSLREIIGEHMYHPLEWFKYSLEDKIKEVVIEDGITSIGDYAFNDLEYLSKIQIPDTVVRIGKYSFSGCGLTSINLPSDLKSIGDGAFNGSNLTSVNLPANLNSIGEFAFSGLFVNEIRIPASVSYIGVGAFCGGSNNLRIPPNIIVEENNNNYSSLNGSLFTKDKKTLITYSYHDKANTYSIPETVEKIQDYAFYRCDYLRTVTFNDKLAYIGSHAFYWCGNLRTVNFNNKLAYIGSHAFDTCTNINSFELPDSVTYIAESAFEDCYLESVKLPSSLKSIESRTFAYCKKLKTLHIEQNVSSIDASAFVGCISLESFTVDKSNVRYYTQDAVLFDSIENKLVKYPQGKKNTTYSIPQGIVSIGDESFAYGLTIGGGTLYSKTPLTNITIPNSVTEIGSYAFSGQKCLKGIIIPKTVTKIGSYAFYNCILKELVIPGSVKQTGVNIAYGSGVNKIELMEGINTINELTFSNSLGQLEDLAEIYLPASLKKIEDEAFYNLKSPLVIHYAGSKSQWDKIEIGKDNRLNRVTIKYNSPIKPKLLLSKNEVSGTSNTKIILDLYKDVYKTPYDGGFKTTVNNESILTTTRNGNSLVLNLKEPGSAVVTIQSTDGSGAEATCDVTVTPDPNPDRYLLERFALSRIVYSDDLTEGYNIKKQNLGAHFDVMYYYDNYYYTSWEDFFKKTIYDYKVLKLPDNPQNGFYAAAFEAPGTGDIIIAYRGTESDTFADLWTDAQMVFDNLNSQFDDAIGFYEDIKSMYPDKEITLTGHSLGGALASYVSVNRGVRCDNINGATGWLFTNDIITETDKTMLSYIGFDKYVYENFDEYNDLFWKGKILGNYSITQIAKKGAFNYNKYEHTQDYNKIEEKIKNGEVKWYPKKDYHAISSIINCVNGKFELTDKTKEYEVDGYKVIDGNIFIGTSKNDNIKKKNSGSGIFVSKTAFVLCGDGNDTVEFVNGGDDTILGNAGDDYLNGGSGSDFYAFSGDWGNDIISDPTGNDIIKLADVGYGDYDISYLEDYALISSYGNSIKVNTAIRKNNITVIDEDGNSKTIDCGKAELFSYSAETDTSKGIIVDGNAFVEIYDNSNKLIDTIVLNEMTDDIVSYCDYGIKKMMQNSLELILPSDGYIVKVKSDETVSIWTVSDADNPTIAKQTYTDNCDLSDGSYIVINTGEIVNEQLSVKIINDDSEESIYSEAPENISITADKSEIKKGEIITLSVSEGFEDAVDWECKNDNAIISVNDDKTVSIIGVKPGEETVRAYIQNDESYTDEFSFVVTEDSAPNVTVTYKDNAYDGSVAATDSVFFDVELVDGYDKVVFSTQSPYSQVEDTNVFAVNSTGNHYINICCENTETGAQTKAFAFEFYQDSVKPEIIGVEDGDIYYTDRVIEVSDTAIDTIYVNDKLYEQTEFIISEVGNYTITATDNVGNSTSVSFQMKEMPAVSDVDVEDFELISVIRDEFEKTKYQLPEDRRTLLEEKITALENAKNSMVVVTVNEGNDIKKMSREKFADYTPPFKDGYTFIGWYSDPEFLPDTKILPSSYEFDDDITVYARYLPDNELVKISDVNVIYERGYIYCDLAYEYVAQDFTLKVDLVNEHNQVIISENVDVYEDDLYSLAELQFSDDISNYNVVFNFLNSDNQPIGKEVVISPNMYSEGFYYKTLNNKAVIVDYDGYDEIAIVPEYLNGYEVVSIGDRAFCDAEDFECILIPATVENISQNAFEDCLDLTKVYYSGSEEEWNNFGLDASDVNNFDVLFNAIFNNGIIYHLTESGAKVVDSLNDFLVSIPVSIDKYPVVSIEEEAFKDSYLEHVKIPNSIKYIDSTAFVGCIYLNDVTYIGTEEEWTEYGLSQENINNAIVEFVEADFVEAYIIDHKYDHKNAVYNIGMIYSFVDSEIAFAIYDEEGNLKNIVTDFVPKGTKITSITMPIEADDKYYETKIFFWDKLNQLRPLSEPVYDYIYAKCERKTSGDFTYIVTKDEAIVVDYTGENTDLSIPSELDGYTVIAVKDIYNLYEKNITSLSLPATIRDFDKWVLADMQYLETISVSEDNNYYSSSDGVLYNKDKSVLIKYPSNKNSVSFRIPDSVEEIGEYALYNSSYLESVIIPQSISKIGDGSFNDCYNLENIYYCNSEEMWYKIDSKYSGIDEDLLSFNYSPDAIKTE